MSKNNRRDGIEIDDGVIKYDRSFFTQSKALPPHDYEELESWRKTLYNLRLIGEYLPEKIGYGNLSQRKDYSSFLTNKDVQFIITGTQTGGLPELKGEHYTRVIDIDIRKLKIVVHGPLEASSESLTHAAIYQANPQIQAIFHIHSLFLWESMLKHNLPSTAADIPYGTLEMAQATIDLVDNHTQGLFAMQGHREGIVAYGKNLEETGKLILELHDRFSP